MTQHLATLIPTHLSQNPQISPMVFSHKYKNCTLTFEAITIKLLSPYYHILQKL